MFGTYTLQRVIATIFAIGAIAIGGVTIAASPAQAGTATCRASLSWNTAYGGCDHHGYASRRMWATCKVIGSNFTSNRATGWHWGSYICWGDSIGCGTGSRVTAAWFQIGQ